MEAHPSQHGFACPWRAIQKHALGRSREAACEDLRELQGIQNVFPLHAEHISVWRHISTQPMLTNQTLVSLCIDLCMFSTSGCCAARTIVDADAAAVSWQSSAGIRDTESHASFTRRLSPGEQHMDTRHIPLRPSTYELTPLCVCLQAGA